MSRQNDQERSAAGLRKGPPPSIRAILADPPILDDEDAGEYCDLMAELGESLEAENALDWLYIESLCQAFWTLRQLREARAVLLRNGTSSGRAEKKAKLIRQRVFYAYDVAYDEEPDPVRKQKLNDLYRIATGRLIDSRGPRPEFAFVKLANMLGVKDQADLVKEVDFDTAEGKSETILGALQSLDGIDELIERREAQLRRIASELDRRHMASAKLRAVKELIETRSRGLDDASGTQRKILSPTSSGNREPEEEAA
jgi:hypothetical protein